MVDLTGQVFGRLTVLRLSEERDRYRELLWLCKCTCGNETLVRASSLRSGATRSCGCLRQESAKARNAIRRYARIARNRER
jgi:hypothetical protein